MCSSSGILVLGGHPDETADQSVEFWSPTGQSCILSNYPRKMEMGPTVDLVSDHLVACYYHTCEIYREGSWQHLQNMTGNGGPLGRKDHNSATTKDAVLLIGGFSSTTEWIPVDGSPSQPGPFSVRRHGPGHCTIQLSDDVIVVTGGVSNVVDPYQYVTQYQMTDGTETPLTSLGQPRYAHACGVYQDTNGQQVS